MAGGDEEDEQQRGAVDAWAVEDVGEGHEGEDKERGGVGRDEEEGKPAGRKC